jgi:rubrerythrin
MRLIDADALKEKIDDMWNGRPLSFLGARILAMIDHAPTIDADRPKGEWKWQRKIDGNLYHRCSECGYFDTERDFLTEYKFCPQCGEQKQEL